MSAEHQDLIPKLANYFNHSRDELPKDLQSLIAGDALLSGWDNLSLGSRITIANQLDAQAGDSFSMRLAFGLVAIDKWLIEEIDQAKLDKNGGRELAFTNVYAKINETDLLRAAEELANQNKVPALKDGERQTLLVIIAAVAKDANIDISKSSKSAQQIENLTGLLGSKISQSAAERHLKMIPEALVAKKTLTPQ